MGTAQAAVLAIFVVCTIRLLIKNASTSPTVTDEALRNYVGFSVEYSAWVLAGYLLMGLGLGSFCWVMLWSWVSTFGGRLTRRTAVAGSALLVAAVLAYKAVACALYSPHVLENICSTDWGIRLISRTGDVAPSWLLTAVRGVFQGAACVLAVAGITCAIRRMNRQVRRAAITVSAMLPIVAGGLGLGLAIEQLPAEPRNDGRPNILILASDGLRPDHLGIYGYDRPTSPNIDRLASEAVRFTQCYVPQARTLPSWTSLLTGTYPHTHGLRYTWPRESHIHLGLPTLCRELKKKGYVSYALSDWVGGDFAKVDYGFDVKRVAPEAWNLTTWIAQATCQGHPLLVAFGDNPVGHRLYPAMNGMPVNPNPQSLTDRAIGALDDLAYSRQPFLMVVFYSETHLPFSTRYPYYRMFSDPRYMGPHKLSVGVPNFEAVAAGKLNPQEYFNPQQTRALYDGAVRSFDDQVGRLLATLRELNLWDDTIVIIASDHGEDLLETPSSWGHGRSFTGDDYDSRIPLIISDPERRGRERSIGEVMSTIDLMPTLLERVGLPVPPTCDGKSLADLVRGERKERDSAIFAETGVWLGGEPELERDSYLRYPPLARMLEVTEPETGQIGLKKEYLDVIIEARHRMVRTSQWKLVYMPLVKGAKYELFDVRNDPHCRTDLKARHPEVFDKLKAELWAWMTRDPERRAEGEHMVRIDSL